MMPLYLSFFPYIVFHMLARQAHPIFGVLWFISLMAINMQMGTQALKAHVIAACAIFLGKTSYHEMIIRLVT
jgi:hypothetical protein